MIVKHFFLSPATLPVVLHDDNNSEQLPILTGASFKI